jgi:hypothetical protein
VAGYHTKRGVQAESIWGAGLLAARHWGHYQARVVAAYGAYDVASGLSGILKIASNILSYGTVALTAVLAWRWVRKDDIGGLSLALFATLTLTIATGRVYSPQYLMWVIGLAAVSLTFAPRRSAPAVAVLTLVVLLSHLEFPFLFWDLLFFNRNYALVVLILRDVLTPVVGVMALFALRAHFHDTAPAPVERPSRSKPRSENGSRRRPLEPVSAGAGAAEPAPNGVPSGEVSVTPHA